MQISSFLVWYLYSLILGIIGLPLAHRIFNNFDDKGWGFSKVIGLLIAGFPLWLLSSLRILEFSSISVFVFTSILLILAIFILVKSNFKFNKFMLVEEVLFFTIFLIWGFIRSTNPRTEGTEKMMNLAFMNSIDKTAYFPPKDMWFSGGNINYYYMGHYFFTFIAKLTSTQISVAYNLALNFVISQFFISLFSIFLSLFKKYSLRKKFLLSFLGSFIISFGGNLFLIFKILQSSIEGESLKYYFPDSTRIIPYTINEYPSYSVVLGDLHGHYNALPFTILVIGLSFVYFKIKPFTRKKLLFSILISPFLVILYGINSWDFITMSVLFLLLNFVNVLKEKNYLFEKLRFLKNYKKYKKQLEYVSRLFYIFFLQILLSIPGIIIFLPYMLNFKPAVGGVGIVPLDSKSDPGLWFLIWGSFVIITILFLVYFFTLKFRKKLSNMTWIFVLLFLSVALVVGVEFIFLKDLFFKVNNNYFRTNTVFKFYYHAWVIWGIVTVYFGTNILFNLKNSLNKNKLKILRRIKTANFLTNFLISFRSIKALNILILTVLYISSVIYVFRAITDFFPLDKVNTGTLDGKDYIRKEYPSDALAIDWIINNVEGQPVIVEAVGDAYTYYGRVSSNTGLTAIMGWPTHEWQWRDNIDEINERKDDIQSLYTTDDQDRLKGIIEKYDVSYVYIGKLEKEKYPNLKVELFNNLFEKAYENSGVIIYKLY